MRFLFFSAVFVLNIVIVLSYSSGAPRSPFVCRRRQPHHGVKPQSDNNPYIITVNTTKPGYGGFIGVTITARDKTRSIKGYLIHAIEDTHKKSKPIGTFIRADKIQRCFHDNDTATHSDNKDKTSVNLVFKMPNTVMYNLFRFHGTVVTNFKTFWTNVVSEPLTPPDEGISPPSDWRKTVIETAKSLSRGKQLWQQNIKQRLSEGYSGMFTSQGQFKTPKIFTELPFTKKDRSRDHKDTYSLNKSKNALEELSVNELTKQMLQGHIQSALVLSDKWNGH